MVRALCFLSIYVQSFYPSLSHQWPSYINALIGFSWGSVIIKEICCILYRSLFLSLFSWTIWLSCMTVTIGLTFLYTLQSRSDFLLTAIIILSLKMSHFHTFSFGALVICNSCCSYYSLNVSIHIMLRPWLLVFIKSFLSLWGYRIFYHIGCLHM